VSQLSPLRPVLGNGDPLIKILRNALTFERVTHILLWTMKDIQGALRLLADCAVLPV